MTVKGLFLSKEKKKELEKELKQLEKKGRKEIAEKLSDAREMALSEDEEDLIMAIEEKELLEDRIREIRDLLFRAKETKEECKFVSDIGSEIVLAHDKSIIIFKLVSPLEVDPSKNKISLESEIGKKLVGLKVNDKVKLNNEDGVEVEYKVLYIC